MKRYKRNYVVILAILLVLFGIYIVFKNTDISSELKPFQDMIATITAVIGAVAIWYQMKREKDLTEAEFIINLNNTFTTNPEIKYIYTKIEQSRYNTNDPFTDEDMIKVVDYLTFFETISSLIQRKVLNLSMINDLFAYRFFVAVNNPHIQRREIIKDSAYYKNLYLLHSKWTRYRKKNSLYIPNEEFSLEKKDENYNLILGDNINELRNSVNEA